MMFRTPNNPVKPLPGIHPIFQHNMDDPELQKRLRDSKTDVTDYFNYGFTERSWRLYSEKVIQLATKTEKIINEDGTSKVLLDKIPLEFGGFGTPHFETIKQLPFFTMIKRHKERFFSQFKRNEERYGAQKVSGSYTDFQEQMRNALYHDQVEETYGEVKATYNQVAPDLLNMKQPLPTANPNLRHRQQGMRAPLYNNTSFYRPYRGAPMFSQSFEASAPANQSGLAETSSTARGTTGDSGSHEASGTQISSNIPHLTSGQMGSGINRSNFEEGNSAFARSAHFSRIQPQDTSGKKSHLSHVVKSKTASPSHSSDRKDKHRRKRDEPLKDRRDDSRNTDRDRRDSSRERRDKKSNDLGKSARRSRSRSAEADRDRREGSKRVSDRGDRDREDKKRRDDRDSRDRKEKKEKEHRDKHKNSAKESSRRKDRSSGSKSSRGSSERGKRSGDYRSSKKTEKASIHDRIRIQQRK